jgi:preprotein translocase subunit YajC
MLDFFFSPAFAQAAGAPQQPSAFVQFAPLVVLFILFYFLLIRPQMKRTKETRLMIEKIAKGDELVLAGGLAGKVVGIGEAFLTVEVSEGVNVKVQKSAVGSVLPKGTLKTL